MEAVSAVKMRKAQASAIAGRPYALAAVSILQRLSGAADLSKHPLAKARSEVKKTAIILVTSDRGLAGGLNSALLREAERLMKRDGLNTTNCEIIGIGKKGTEYFARRGFALHASYEKWGEGIGEEDPSRLIDTIVEAYTLGGFDKVYLLYTHFRSTLRQEPIVRTMLPLMFSEIERIVADIVPEKGKYAELREHTESPQGGYLFEPSPERVLEVLIPRLLSIELYHAVLEANASEHSARMVAMKSASDRASDVGKSLTRLFNRQRQSKITSEISEIVTGVEAMK